jgi:YVTN family beta-propeller protein
MGLAFGSDRDLYVSEGDSGRVRLLRLERGNTRDVLDLNQGELKGSYTGDLAIDRQRALLYVVDQTNSRVAIIDLKRKRVVSSVQMGPLPFAAALSPDAKRLYVTNLGMSEASGPGDAIKPQPNSLAVVNVENPAAPQVESFVPTGIPFGADSLGGSSPSGVVADTERIFISNAHNDSITVVNAKTLQVEREIPLRIQALETLRGIVPVGLALHAASGWLLVAEAGINAVGVIDTRTGAVLGHIPTGWFPTRVVLDQDTVLVANAKGHGTGPNDIRQRRADPSIQTSFRRGTIGVFPLPAAEELPKLTATVYGANGFRPLPESEKRPLPPEVRYVVLIVKENRTYDEVLGDIETVSNGEVRGSWDLARFGRFGTVAPERGELRMRLVMRRVNVTPNQHEIALRWAFSDNFYADSEVDGHQWLVGAYPNAWTESSAKIAGPFVPPENQPESGLLWHHLERNGISFRMFGERLEKTNSLPSPLTSNLSQDYPGPDASIPDQLRAARFISEVDRLYRKGGTPLPRFIYIHLPNDQIDRVRPEDGYPFPASYVADNDVAVGRIVEYLSGTEWWKHMAIFVTEDDAHGGVDHIDSHRTVLLVAGPWVKKNYVSRLNSSLPGLLKTVFRLLGIGPLNLYDATATDLADCFTSTPDFAPYKAVMTIPDLFDPAKAREPSREQQNTGKLR